MRGLGAMGLVETSRVEIVDPSHAESIVALFERCDAPCFCQYFQYPGDNRDWQMRCGLESEENARALRQQLAGGDLRAFVSLTSGKAIGWLRLERPQLLDKRYQGRLYRGLPCLGGERAGVLSVVCFLVDSEYRGQGVARALLSAALEWGKAEGVKSIEAFPRGASDVSCEEQWTGPVRLYEALGFTRVHDFSPYPVFRFDF